MFEGYGWSWGIQNYCHAGSSVPEAHPHISSSPAVQHERHLRSACRPGLLALPSGMPFNSVFIDVLNINQDCTSLLESSRDSKLSSLETWAQDVDRDISMASFFLLTCMCCLSPWTLLSSGLWLLFVWISCLLWWSSCCFCPLCQARSEWEKKWLGQMTG